MVGRFHFGTTVVQQLALDVGENASPEDAIGVRRRSRLLARVVVVRADVVLVRRREVDRPFVEFSEDLKWKSVKDRARFSYRTYSAFGMFLVQLIVLEQLVIGTVLHEMFDLRARNGQSVVEVAKEEDVIVPQCARWRLECELLHDRLVVLVALVDFALASGEMRADETDRRVVQHQADGHLYDNGVGRAGVAEGRLTQPLLPILPPMPVFTESTTMFLKDEKCMGRKRDRVCVLDERSEIASNEYGQADADQLIIAEEDVLIVRIESLEVSFDVVHPTCCIHRTRSS